MNKDANETGRTAPVDVIFLGLNDAGQRVYDWLCDQDDVIVRAMITEREQLSLVRENPPDYLISVGFQHIVPPEVLNAPTSGCLNLHPGLLPYNRGANPNVWSIVDRTRAGVTLHYMDETLDTGDVIAQRRVKKRFEDTGRDLHNRLERAAVGLFKDAWPHIVEGTATGAPQEAEAGTYHTTAEFEQLCELDTEATYTVRELLNVLRALTFPPYDNAYVDIEGNRYYIEVDIQKCEDSAGENRERE